MSKKETVIIKLKYPLDIEVEGNIVKLEELKAGRPKGKAIKKLPIGYFDDPEAKMEGIEPFICKWLNITGEQFDELDADDIFQIMEVMVSFLGGSLGIGKS